MRRAGKDRRRRAGLDHLAGVHHQQVLHAVGHHGQVVADEQQRHAGVGHQRGQQVQHLALHRHVERRRRLVGDQQVRPAGQRDGDHHPLALAAGQLVRVGGQPLRGLRQLHAVQQPQRLGARRRADKPRCRRNGSAICRPTVCSGFSAVIGSWNTMPRRAPRSRHSAGSDRVVSSWPSKRIDPDTRALGQQAHQGQRGQALAAARLADQAQRAAARERKRHAPQGRGGAAGRGQRDMQPVDLEQVHAGTIAQRPCRGVGGPLSASC